MGLFWPNKFKPEPNALTRTARVIHWGAVLLALAWIVGGSLSVISFTLAMSQQYGWSDELLWRTAMGFGITAIIALVGCLAGRGIRYIMSGE